MLIYLGPDDLQLLEHMEYTLHTSTGALAREFNRPRRSMAQHLRRLENKGVVEGEPLRRGDALWRVTKEGLRALETARVSGRLPDASARAAARAADTRR